MSTFTVDVPVRYRDLDPLDHVNNAVYATYLEEVRTTFLAEVLELESGELSFVLANLEIDYGRPITLGDQPTVTLEVVDVGTTSCTFAHEIRVDGEAVATASSTIVHVDPEARRPAEIPDELRRRAREYERQETTA